MEFKNSSVVLVTMKSPLEMETISLVVAMETMLLC